MVPGYGNTYGTHADARAENGDGDRVDADADRSGADTCVSKTIADCWRWR